MNAGAIFSYLTGNEWTHTKEGAGYVSQKGELVIYEYFYDRSGYNHFQLKD
jgi:hypothetical protein